MQRGPSGRCWTDSNYNEEARHCAGFFVLRGTIVMPQSASDMVDLYIQAEKDVLEGKTTTINGRTMTLEDLESIRQGRREWERRLQSSTGKRSRGPAVANFY